MQVCDVVHILRSQIPKTAKAIIATEPTHKSVDYLLLRFLILLPCHTQYIYT